MHWQFGGNLEPVQMICELDWRECPKAIANYVWNEIVTDVLDCLNNEGIVWRILALLLAGTILLRTVCSKTKEFIETAVDKEMLNKIGYKMEDLELKVNILTYKMQYGTWPLPHQVQKSNFRNHLRNLRLTMSSPNDRNNWIKHVLLSPRYKESYTSYPKYDYRSAHRLTELFDAKKKLAYPYLRQECLPMGPSSKSSKTSSDKSLKLNSIFKRRSYRKRREASQKDNNVMQYRNAISLPHFSKNKKSSSKASKRFKDKTMTGACKKFMKTMDECKRYLKELHDSNKNLGLVCSSSNITDESSMKERWSETEQQNQDENDDESSEMAKEIITEEKGSKKIDKKQEISEKCSELSNAVCPVLKSSDKHVRASRMNITLCADMFPRQSASSMLVPEPCERTKSIKTSQEALYKVKKKLESLHNVLRTYEIQTVEAKTSAKLQESNNKINDICQNVKQTIVSAITEADKWNEDKRNRVNFDSDTRKIHHSEMERTVCNSSEHDESNATANNSMKSIQSYSNKLNTYSINNLNDPHCLLPNNLQPAVHPSITQELDLFHDNKIVYSSSSKYEKVPERVYYAISSDSDEGKNDKIGATIVENFASLPDIYTDKNQQKPSEFSDPIPMETDEDLIITSPTSSHTEISKDSESEDKPTALLLQEALQFKKALLTRVQLEKICYIDDQKGNTNSQCIAECGKYSYVNNNLQSKLLDIISEEQSVSSSTDKTSRTYMFYNVQQDKEMTHSLMFNANIPDFPEQREVRGSSASKVYLGSEHTLSSPSEYFSFTNIVQDESGNNNNQLCSLQQNYLHQNVSTGSVSTNVQIKCFNDALNRSNVKLTEMNYTNCLNTSNTTINGQKTRYDYIHEKENFENHLLDLNNRNEFVNDSIHSMELYSENLDEVPSHEENRNLSVDITSNFLNSDRYENVSYKKTENDGVLNTKINVATGETYMKNNRNSMHTPNLNLKRHPGICSLIEQVLTTNIKKETEINAILENENAMYELSPTESKETSVETNLIQDSISSTINQSNDSNIPEPPSVTVLINKSSDEENLNLSWLSVNGKYSDEYVNETGTKTLSTSTLTLKKLDTTNTENYTKKETICSDHKVFVSDQSNQFKDEKKNSIIKDSFVSLGKENRNNETDSYKSYPIQISPHSSLYFTDEASSSITKLNNNHSRSLENHLHPNLYLQKRNEEKPCYKDENCKDINNMETMSSEKKTMNVTIAEDNEKSSKQKLSKSKSNAYSNHDVYYSGNHIKDTNIPETEKTFSTENSRGVNDESLSSYNDNNNSNLQSSKSVNITSNRIENFIETLNLDHQYFSPSTSTHENGAINKTNVTVKSKSNENYTPKSKNLKKSGLRSEQLNGNQNRDENNTNSNSSKRRHTTENNIKIDKKRSRSQTSLRTNESPKQVALRSHESPRNISTINDTESVENKFKLKDLKYLSPIPKTSSKSCIPILKSRLEAARRSENETRPKSPMRGPLTMTMFWKDNLCSKNNNVAEEIQVEGKSENYNRYMDVNNYGEKSDDNNNHADTMKSSKILQNTIENIDNNIAQQEQMVIYVNIFTKHDHNTTKIVDPNKFLEYIKNRELKIQNTEKSQCENEKTNIHGSTVENENSTMHKIVTIVSSVINRNELDQAMSTNASVTKTENESLSNVITSSELKNLCFFSVEQREIDVTAKPSVIDTSTSISDLRNISDTENTLSKFQICGVPRELNNEEYVTLLELLHQEPNFVHLQELQSVCKKLASEELKLK